ncbi:glycosyltransferase family 2 protein [Aeromonas caviae]|uniref:glycosyltransferase family 2 protein n=1 Tax=Aeromonas caviae TaxID=648 RepID=UPI0015DD6944|nr:glycosyltransferase [Aeromonas caviae]QLL85278.1 glycosyltransferase [Aeromonas caviae]
MVSVIMPIYNGGLYLREAVESVLNQTYTNFELICIDDGSTDNTLEILNEYASRDKRIRVVSRENKGLITTLNEGISLANFDYIARMDADDISSKDRFLKQINFLKKNKDVAVVGCSYQKIDAFGNIIGYRKQSASPYFLRALSLFGSPLAHPSVVINRSILNADYLYDNNYDCAEDYELWLRILKKYKISNINDFLIKYRILESSISRSKKEQQQYSVARALCSHNNVCSVDLINSFLVNRCNKWYFFRKIICNKMNLKFLPATVLIFIFFVISGYKNDCKK